MNIKKAERIKYMNFWNTFIDFPLNDEWAFELYNYILNGLKPGSFFTSMYANDLHGAVIHSHVMNRWSDIQDLVKWVNEHAPHQCWGDYQQVTDWLALTKEERYKICSNNGFILTDEEVTWHILNKKELKND